MYDQMEQVSECAFELSPPPNLDELRVRSGVVRAGGEKSKITNDHGKREGRVMG